MNAGSLERIPLPALRRDGIEDAANQMAGAHLELDALTT